MSDSDLVGTPDRSVGRRYAPPHGARAPPSGRCTASPSSTGGSRPTSARVRDVWVEGEISELRRSPAWATVFLTLKDARTGACLSATMPRRRFDPIEPVLAEGERVQANGSLSLYEARGEVSLRVGDARARRRGRPRGGARAAPAHARRGGPLRARAQAPAAAVPARRRAPHGRRRRRARRRRCRDRHALPRGAARDRRDPGAGALGAGRDRRGARHGSRRATASTW